MSRHDSRLVRPAVAGRPRRYPKVRGGRLPSRVCPYRHRIGDMAYRALPGASPRSPGILAAWHVGRGNPRPGPGFPDRRRIAPGASGFPGCRVSPVHGRNATVNAELLRRAQDALDFRVAPARPSKDGSKARRTIQASSAGHQLNFPVAPAATGAAPGSAPRHYRRPSQTPFGSDGASGQCVVRFVGYGADRNIDSMDRSRRSMLDSMIVRRSSRARRKTPCND